MLNLAKWQDSQPIGKMEKVQCDNVIQAVLIMILHKPLQATFLSLYYSSIQSTTTTTPTITSWKWYQVGDGLEEKWAKVTHYGSTVGSYARYRSIHKESLGEYVQSIQTEY